MNIFVLSDQCGHCILIKEIPDMHHLPVVQDEAVGAVCFCGTRGSAREDLKFVALEDEVEIPRRTSDELETVRLALLRLDRYQVFSKALAAMVGPSHAREFYDKGDWGKAVIWSRVAAEAEDDPTQKARCYLLLAESEAKRGDLVKAEVACLCALDCGSAADDVRAMAVLRLGMFRWTSDIPSALEALRQAFDMSVQPASSMAAIRLGEYWEHKRDSGKALEYYQAATASKVTRDDARDGLRRLGRGKRFW